MGMDANGLSHWTPEPGETPALRDQTVGDLVDEAAERWPDREAIVYSVYDDLGISVRWTYAELRERSRRAARALMAAGVGQGDRVGMWATNLPEWPVVQFATAYAGAILVPLNPLYREREVEFVLGKAGVSACIVLPENRNASLWEILAKVSARLPDLRTRIAIGEAPGADGAGWDEWIAAGERISEHELDARIATVRPEDTSQIQFTSGTTGFPKGAELRHYGIVNVGRLFADRANFPDGGRHSNPMPFFHCGGCVQSTLGAVATGSAQLPAITFDAERIVRTIETEQATSVSAVPTMMIAMEEAVDRGAGSLDSLQVVVTGGSPVPVELEERWIARFGTAFSITYGLTEASPVISQTSPDDPLPLQLGTCGRALPHVEMDVADPVTDQPVPVGEQGELRTRGWLVMNGYWDDPEATVAAISADGFLRSGDLARMDADGYVSIIGRAKEMIIRGGENLYPREIEDAIRTLPIVADVAVVGVPDERYGEECAAFVRLTAGATLDREALAAELTDKIARFKIPRYVRVVDEFPLTPSGKVRKFKLREQFMAQQ